jgi:hypothetical protein
MCENRAVQSMSVLFMLAAGLLAAPGAATAAIAVSDTTSGGPWTLSDGTPTIAADGPLSGTESFTIAASPTNSVLIVNYTEFAQSNSPTGLDAKTSIKWNGTPLTPAIVQISSLESFIYAEVFYLFDPNPAVNGSLVVSGSGRDTVLGAYTLTGVNTNLAPTTYGHDSSNGTSSVTLSGTTAAGSFAAITGAFRLGTGNFAYLTSSGPAATELWTLSPDPSTNVASCSAYVSDLGAGALIISQSDNAQSRNEIAVAVFAPAAVPEPGTLTLFSAGVLPLLIYRLKSAVVLR